MSRAPAPPGGFNLRIAMIPATLIVGACAIWVLTQPDYRDAVAARIDGMLKTPVSEQRYDALDQRWVLELTDASLGVVGGPLGGLSYAPMIAACRAAAPRLQGLRSEMRRIKPPPQRAERHERLQRLARSVEIAFTQCAAGDPTALSRITSDH